MFCPHTRGTSADGDDRSGWTECGHVLLGDHLSIVTFREYILSDVSIDTFDPDTREIYRQYSVWTGNDPRNTVSAWMKKYSSINND